MNSDRMQRSECSIELSDIHHWYGKSAVLSDITFSVPHGQLLAVVGPSGCGKSTLLRLIAGLLQPSRGSIRLCGTNVAKIPAYRREIGMVFQDLALYPHFTVAKNLEYSISSKRLRRNEKRERVLKTASNLGIEDFLKHHPAELSGGQRQRVAIGRAIIREPKILLLDEPLSQLDPYLRTATRQLLLDLHKSLGTTTIYVTHDASEALRVADRIIVMRGGSVVDDRDPGSLYNDPSSIWVATFFGDPPINLLRGQVSDGRLFVLANEVLLDAMFNDSTTLTYNKDVIVGFRSSAVSLASCSHVWKETNIPSNKGAAGLSLTDRFQRGPMLTFSAEVRQLYRLDDRIGVTLSADGETFESILPLCCNSSTISTDRPTDFQIPISSLYIFDAETGMRIMNI